MSKTMYTNTMTDWMNDTLDQGHAYRDLEGLIEDMFPEPTVHEMMDEGVDNNLDWE